ncbi:5165_t:CDS:2 [Entrophospora sp. SA101]|nr:5165_t:CDS:2 [Entrophospora sp. SA101]
MSPTFTDLCGESDSITQQTNDILYKINKIEKEELEQLEGYLMLREQQQSLKKKHDELFKKLQYLSDKYNNKLPRRLKDALKKFQKPSKNKSDVHVHNNDIFGRNGINFYKNESTTTIDEINRNYLQSRLDCSNKLMQVKRELFKCIEEQNVVDQNKESLKKKKQKLQLEKQSLLGLKQKLEQKQNDLMLTGFLGK